MTTRARRMVAPVALIGGLAAATVALHYRDPHTQGSWGECPSVALLGLYCPGCGGLRAVNDLTDGRFADAASSNVLFFLFVPVIVFAIAMWTLHRWRGEVYRPKLLGSNAFAFGLAAVLLVFTVARNLPGLDWLAP